MQNNFTIVSYYNFISEIEIKTKIHSCVCSDVCLVYVHFRGSNFQILFDMLRYDRKIILMQNFWNRRRGTDMSLMGNGSGQMLLCDAINILVVNLM